MSREINLINSYMRTILCVISVLVLSGCTSGYDIKESISEKFPNGEIYQIESNDDSRYIMIDSLGSIYLIKVNYIFNKYKVKSVTKIK